MKMIVFVDCEYWSHDISRFRLAIMRQTLIESLRKCRIHKNDTLFVLKMCPMDPRWSERIEAFRGFHRCTVFEQNRIAHYRQIPRIEMNLHDDVSLHPEFFRTAVHLVSQQSGKETIFIDFNAGYVLRSESTQAVTTHRQPVRLRMIRSKGRAGRTSVSAGDRRLWLQVAHKYSDYDADQIATGDVSNDSLWSAVHLPTLKLYCGVRMCTGTAAGAVAFRHRSKSFIHAESYSRGRRR